MSLTNKDASIVLAMIMRGDKHHDIAAWFGENQGRVDDVKKGDYGVSAAPAEDLPPKGAPGLKGRRLRSKVRVAIDALETGDVASALEVLKAGLENYNQNET
jgi:hypothetical protein